MKKTNSFVMALTFGLLLVAGCATTGPHITREQYLANSKITVAIMPFEGDRWGVAEDIMEAFQKAGFKVVERYRIKQIVGEQSFGLSGLTESDYYDKIGKLLGVDRIIYGSAYSKYVPYYPSNVAPGNFLGAFLDGYARGRSGIYIYASLYSVEVRTGEIKVIGTDVLIKKL